MKCAPFVIPLLLAAACGGATDHYTGFVEGEERLLRSEVMGRILEVAFAEGDTVPADVVVARVDDADVRARIAAKEQEIAVIDADLRTATERVTLARETWERSLAAAEADLRQATTTATVAERTLVREADLVRAGASTAQLLDEAQVRRDQAASARTRAAEVLARTRAEERRITVAESERATLAERRTLVEAQLAELRVTAAKYEIRAPSLPTVVQTQHAWPGELAQSGTPIISVLDPRDKYVQLYVPVAEVTAFRVGRRVAIELDSLPGTRTPGEVAFVADRASFTPEKIETRDDRMSQVYRVKVRILEDVERFQPGTEGNVTLVADDAGA